MQQTRSPVYQRRPRHSLHPEMPTMTNGINCLELKKENDPTIWYTGRVAAQTISAMPFLSGSLLVGRA